MFTSSKYDYFKEIKLKMISVHHVGCSFLWKSQNHQVDYNKFYYFQGGEGRIVIDGKEYYPRKGDLLLIPAKAHHSYEQNLDNMFTKYYCHFQVETGGVNLFESIEIPLLIHVQGREVETIFEQLVRYECTESITSIFKVKEYLFKLLAYFIDEASQDPVAVQINEQTKLVLGITHYIDGHLREALSPASVADRVHLHPNYVMSLFKKHTGRSIGTYITEKRIERARRLLETTHLNIKEIANKVGIENPYYFSNLFKKTTGLAPTAYRVSSQR